MKQQVKIYKIKGNPKNPRVIKNDKFKLLKNSIKTLPNYMKLRPVILNEDMMVLGGNMRLKASLDLGKKEIWTDMFTQADCDEMNEIAIEEERETKTYLEYCDEIIIKDNVSAGEWEWDMLANEWDSVQLNDFGLDVWENEDDKVTEGLIDDDEIPEVTESIVKRGDIWQLGEHRVMCGDSTSSDDVEKLMNGEKVDILITDPPYGIDLDTDYSKMGATTTKYEKIKGDSSEFDLKDVISISGTKEQYIWGGDYFVNSLDWMSGTQIIWAKRHSEKENKVFGSAFESLWVSYKCKKVIFFIRPINQSSERLGKHPTQKPIECMSRCIEMSKLTGNIYDAFLGSGTTLIAAEKLNRKCYGMELDEKYCDVIINRWEQFTGLKAVKI